MAKLNNLELSLRNLAVSRLMLIVSVIALIISVFLPFYLLHLQSEKEREYEINSLGFSINSLQYELSSNIGKMKLIGNDTDPERYMVFNALSTNNLEKVLSDGRIQNISIQLRLNRIYSRVIEINNALEFINSDAFFSYREKGEIDSRTSFFSQIKLNINFTKDDIYQAITELTDYQKCLGETQIISNC